MSTSSTNYRETVFAHHDLTQIQGEPTFSSLKLLTREVKANAMAVHSTIGGGAHGHLGLVLSAAQYANISPTPFVRPAFPAPLVIPAGTTAVAAKTLEREYNESLRLFREVMGVENSLKQQLIKAVDSSFLEAIRDPVTYVLEGTIAANLTFLMTTYGRVTPEMLNDEHDEVTATIYNPSLPIDIIFNKIIALSELADAAGIPYSQQQQLTLAYNILNRSGRFVSDIKEWKRRPAIERTWFNLKTHFRRAHDELRETSNDTLQAMQHANIAQQVIEGIAHLIPPPEPTDPTPPPATPPTQPAPPSATDTIMSPLTNTGTAFYSTEPNMIIPSLMQQMTQMQTMMMNMQNSVSGSVNHDQSMGERGNGRGRGRGRGRRRGNRNGGRTGYLPLTHYCWTHGWCRHNGTDCAAPAEGHKPDATKTNRMGGSTRNLNV